MRKLSAATLLFLSGACSGSDRAFVARPEFEARVQSLVIVSERSSGFALRATALEDWETPLEVEIDEILRLQILAYREDLETLAWPAGDLRPAEASDCARSTLSAPLERHVLEVSDGDLEFTIEPGLPAELASLELAAVCPCKSFELEDFDINVLGRARSIDLWRDGYRLQTAAGLYELSSAFEVSSSTIGMGPERMFTDAEGTSWVGAFGGRVLRWPVDGPVEVVMEAPEIGLIERISPGARPDEFLLVTRSGFYVWSGGAPRLLGGSIPRAGSNQISVLVSLPNGVSLAGLYRNYGLLRRRPGSEMTEPVDWSSDLDPPQFLDFLPDIGVLLSTRSNQIFRSEDEGGHWVDITPSEPELQLSSSQDFIPFERGFLELGRGGLRQFSLRSGYCPAVRFDEAVDMRTGFFLPDGRLLIVGDAAEGDALSTDAYLLTPNGPR